MRRFTTFIFSFHLLINCISAQELRFDNINIDNGLSNNWVQSILQDKRGYIWFATQDGLNRYDGYNLETYRANPSDTNSLGGNDIRYLYEDRQGNIWVLLHTGNISVYDPITEKFSTYKFSTTENDKIIDKGQEIFDDNICESGSGDIWIGFSSGLYRINRREKRITKYISNKSDENSISDNNVNTIIEDKEGRIWAGTNKGLNCILPKENKIIRFLHDEKIANSIVSNQITSLFSDKRGTLWVGTAEGYLDTINLKDKNTAFGHFHGRKGQTHSFVFKIIETKGKELFVLINGLVIKINSKRHYSYIKHPLYPNDLYKNAFQAITQDARGNVWLGGINSSMNFVQN